MQHVPDDDELSERPWEIVHQRKRIPVNLRQHLGLQTGILRVSRQVDTKIRAQHASEVDQYETLDELLPQWVHALPDPSSSDTWQIYIPLDAKHWPAVVVGKEQSGSFNLISVFRIRDRNVRNRLERALEN
jgi:hypothetical protein